MHKYKYVITISSDDGNCDIIDVVADAMAMNRLAMMVYGSMDISQSIEIEPEPLGRIDDLRNLLDRRVEHYMK